MIKVIDKTNFNNVMKNTDKLGVLNTVGRMQANKSVENTELHHAFVVNADSMGYSFGDDDRPQRITKAFFASTSYYLSKAKIANEDEAVALVLTDVSGNFKFAGIVKYNANTENPDEPGNWDYSFTFNEDDVTELESTRKVKKLLYGDQAFHSIFDKIGYDIASIQFEQERYMYDACLLTVDTLIQILDNEAIPGEDVDIEMPGYFVATVRVENDEKEFSITPDGHMKEIIKDDSKLDVLN
jgi:hypothetical protein